MYVCRVQVLSDSRQPVHRSAAPPGPVSSHRVFGEAGRVHPRLLFRVVRVTAGLHQRLPGLGVHSGHQRGLGRERQRPCRYT